MVTPDVPEAAVEAAAQSMPYQVEDRYEVAREALVAAAPHLRTDERARVLAEVQAALLRFPSVLMNPREIWTVLRDTVGAGGEG